nr:hypothetical protein [Nocardia carnea]
MSTLTAAVVHSAPCQPCHDPIAPMTGPAQTAASDWIAVTMVAARPMFPEPENRAVANVSRAGVSSAVAIPMPRQKTVSAAKVPVVASTHATASRISAATATYCFDHRASNGATAIPATSAARPPSPRRNPIPDSGARAVAAIGTRNVE